ncbi:unnamed protein product [Thlaspi arvense]|uniref:Protease Do-like PDZ domain-containing protein n=1 Tax=Thlaspi arvense TaxID=13288 RepID=A0AAU9SNB3_THLAR|nr:unnamed protein product [Thlaspi arvense]
MSFYNSSSTLVPRLLYPPLISRFCSSVCVDSPSESAQENTSRSAIDSVVKIFSFYRKPNVVQPWQTTEKERSGSGFAIFGRRILTSAHVANDHSYVQVKKHGSPTKHKTRVEAFAYDCDLAILVVDNEKFWEDLNPLELGDTPLYRRICLRFSYVMRSNAGGRTISVTKGIVSRVEPGTYNHSSIELLALQIDAAINTGNGGGPVVMGNKVVGMASEMKKYIIPTPVIKLFLSGVEETGQYIGFCSLSISYQSMEDANLRKHFKMSPEMSGILINEINPLSGAQGILKKDDVILAIDGVSIGNDERGFVFVPLSKPYIDSDHSVKVCKCPSEGKPKKAGEQIVIISQVLLNDITAEYRDFKEFQVKKVNGVEVLNLRHLSELVEECRAEELRLELENEKVIVVNYKSAKEATTLMLEHHGIRSAMSKDLKKEASELASSAVA